jgi:hypothetical protein
VSDTEVDVKAVAKGLSDQYRDILQRFLPDYERIIGLPEPNSDFREKVSHAVTACMFQRMYESNQIRGSLIRKDLMLASKAARTAHHNLCLLNDALRALPNPVLCVLEQSWSELGESARRWTDDEILWLRCAAAVTESLAKRIVDKGGAPEMRAFRVLAKGLAEAFQAATGRPAKVNWNAMKDCWDGKFLKLVEAVLPLAEMLSGTERPLRTPKALGPYLHDITRAKSRNRKSPRPGRKP